MKKKTSRLVEMKAAAIERKAGATKVLEEPFSTLRIIRRGWGWTWAIDLDGELAVEGAVATREASLRVQFEGKARMRIALEAGMHSPWISRLIVELGHNVIVERDRSKCQK